MNTELSKKFYSSSTKKSSRNELPNQIKKNNSRKYHHKLEKAEIKEIDNLFNKVISENATNLRRKDIHTH